jgi:carboxylesterase
MAPGIGCETLVMHSREDELTSARSATWLQQHLGPSSTEIVLLDDSYHMVCIDNERKIVADRILAFLAKHPAAAPPETDFGRHQ